MTRFPPHYHEGRCGPSPATSGDRATPVMILNQENIMKKLDQHKNRKHATGTCRHGGNCWIEINRLKDDRLVLAVLLAMFACHQSCDGVLHRNPLNRPKPKQRNYEQRKITRIAVGSIRRRAADTSTHGIRKSATDHRAGVSSRN